MAVTALPSAWSFHASVGVVHDVESACDVVRRLVAEVEAILRDRPAELLA